MMAVTPCAGCGDEKTLDFLIKIDMDLVRDIATSPAKQAIAACVTEMARTIGITMIAEGIETSEALVILKAAGISLFQGYLFAKLGIAQLPYVAFSLAA